MYVCLSSRFQISRIANFEFSKGIQPSSINYLILAKGRLMIPHIYMHTIGNLEMRTKTKINKFENSKFAKERAGCLAVIHL